MTDDKLYTSLSANTVMAKLTNQHYSLDSEDDFRSGCRNISHQKTVLFRTTFTRTITLYELLILLGSNHLQCYVHLDDRANDLRTTTSVQ